MTYRIWDRTLLVSAVIVTLIAFVSIWLTVSAAPDAIKRLSLLAFLPAYAAAVASHTPRKLGSHYFQRRNDIAIAFWRTLRVRLVGDAPAVTPGRVGELFKLRLINEGTGMQVVQAAPLLLIDRLTEGGGLLILAIASALVIPSLGDNLPAACLVFLGLAAMVPFGLTLGQWKRVARFAGARLA